MTSASTDPAYDSIAHWYHEWVGDDDAVDTDPYAGPTLDLIGDVSDQRICDLACGQGRITRALARRGAQVVGVDNSGELLTIARQHDMTGIEYRHDNAHTLASCQDAEFDGVVCNMSLMDITDLTATMITTHRILRPGGWFVFSTFHPCFNTPHSAPKLWTRTDEVTARSPTTSAMDSGSPINASGHRAPLAPTTGLSPPCSTRSSKQDSCSDASRS